MVSELVGQKVQIIRSGLVFYCECLAVRSPRARGTKPEILVAPVEGHGEKWVSDWMHLNRGFGFVEGPVDGKDTRDRE